MSVKYPHVFAFRCTDEERAVVDDVIASYPGMAAGTALRAFMMSGEVAEILRRRSGAYRAREALTAREALRAMLGDDGEPGSTPSDLLAPPESPAE